MNDIVEGFKNQTWLIRSYNGTDQTAEQQIPYEDTTEEKVIEQLEAMAKETLTPEEIEQSPHLYSARIDGGEGNRIIISAGMDPHFTASLWRQDELP